MERDIPAKQIAVADEISRMIWEGSPVTSGDNPEPESVVGLENSRFPERVGRIR